MNMHLKVCLLLQSFHESLAQKSILWPKIDTRSSFYYGHECHCPIPSMPTDLNSSCSVFYRLGFGWYSALKEPGYSSTQVRQITLITREHKCHPYLFWKVFFPALRIHPAHDFVQGARWWPFYRLNFIWEMRRVSRGPCLGLKSSSTPFQPWNTPAEAQIPYFSGGSEDNSSRLEFQ